MVGIHFLHLVGIIKTLGQMGISQHHIGNVYNLVKRPPVTKTLIYGLHLKALQFITSDTEHLPAAQFTVGDQVVGHHITQYIISGIDHGFHIFLRRPVFIT